MDTTTEEEKGHWDGPMVDDGRGEGNFIPLKDVESYLENGTLRIIVAVKRYPDEED